MIVVTYETEQVLHKSRLAVMSGMFWVSAYAGLSFIPCVDHNALLVNLISRSAEWKMQR